MKTIKHGNEFANDTRKDGYIHLIVLGSFFIVGIVIGFALAVALLNQIQI
jgi:hypothetical protein